MDIHTNEYIRLKITRIGDPSIGALSVSYTTELTTLYREVEKGIYSCYIPAIDVYYTACSFDDIDNVGEGMVESFLHHGLHVVGALGFRQKLKSLSFFPQEGQWKVFENNPKEDQKFSKRIKNISKEFNKHTKKTIRISNSISKAA